MLVWDPTKAANSHAALSGVLAGIVFAVLAILITREHQSGKDNTTAAGESDPVPARVLKLLVLAFFFLVVAAVMWGGLAGHAPVDQVAKGLESNPGPREKSALRATLVNHFVTGTSAVVILGLGALSLLAAIAEVLPMGAQTDREQLFEFSRNAFGWLGALGIFEVSYFAVVALDLAIYPWISAPDTIALSFGLVTVACAFGMRRAVRSVRRPGSWTRYLLNVELARSVSIKAAVASGVTATLAYITTPTPTVSRLFPIVELGTYSRWHIAATLLALGATVLFAGFVVSAMWALQLSDFTPSAAESSPEGPTPDPGLGARLDAYPAGLRLDARQRPEV